jgi:hypothetical protein
MAATITKELKGCIGVVFAAQTLNQNPAAAITLNAKRVLLKTRRQAVPLEKNVWRNISVMRAVHLLISILKQANHTAAARCVQKTIENIKESTQENHRNNLKLLTVPNNIVKSLPKVLTKER